MSGIFGFILYQLEKFQLDVSSEIEHMTYDGEPLAASAIWFVLILHKVGFQAYFICNGYYTTEVNIVTSVLVFYWPQDLQ